MIKETQHHTEVIKQKTTHKNFDVEIDIIKDIANDKVTITIFGKDVFDRNFYCRHENESTNISFNKMDYDIDIANELNLQIKEILVNL